jgi:hypothetical protein
MPDDDLIEIRDPEIDAAAIMAEIRSRIEERRAGADFEEESFPTFGAATPYPAGPAEAAAESGLYYHLWLANQTYNQAETAPFVAASPATQLPVLGRLWQLIREQAHQLVLFYVNRFVSQQTNVNRHLVSVANELTRELQEQQQQLRALEDEVRAMRESEGRG